MKPMLRWTALLCICLYLVFVLGPDPAPPVQDPGVAAPETPTQSDTSAVTLESGEVWAIDRVIGAGDPAQDEPPVVVEPNPPSVAPSAIEAAVQEAQSAAVEAEVTEPAEPEPPAAETQITLLYVTGTRVNLRAGPSTDDTIVTALTQGTPVEWIGEAPDGWLEIRDTLSGALGFMSGDFLSPEAP